MYLPYAWSGVKGLILSYTTKSYYFLKSSLDMSSALTLMSHFVELEFQQLQYWATSASCLGVLVFLCYMHCHLSSNAEHEWSIKVSISCIALFAAVCCLSFVVKSAGGKLVH